MQAAMGWHRGRMRKNGLFWMGSLRMMKWLQEDPAHRPGRVWMGFMMVGEGKPSKESEVGGMF